MIWIPCELSSKFTNLIHQLWRIEQSGLCHFIVLIYDDLIVIVMWVCSAVVIQAWYCKLACSVSWLTQLSLSSSSLGMPHHQWNIWAEAVLWLLLWSLVYFLLHALSPLPFWCFIFFFSLHLLVLKKNWSKRWHEYQLWWVQDQILGTWTMTGTAYETNITAHNTQSHY